MSKESNVGTSLPTVPNANEPQSAILGVAAESLPLRGDSLLNSEPGHFADVRPAHALDDLFDDITGRKLVKYLPAEQYKVVDGMLWESAERKARFDAHHPPMDGGSVDDYAVIAITVALHGIGFDALRLAPVQFRTLKYSYIACYATSFLLALESIKRGRA